MSPRFLRPRWPLSFRRMAREGLAEMAVERGRRVADSPAATGEGIQRAGQRRGQRGAADRLPTRLFVAVIDVKARVRVGDRRDVVIETFRAASRIRPARCVQLPRGSGGQDFACCKRLSVAFTLSRRFRRGVGAQSPRRAPDSRRPDVGRLRPIHRSEGWLAAG